MKLTADTTFIRARTEIESLGFTVSYLKTPDSTPYGIISGRSNARWWLVPLANNNIAISGLALFQPVIPSARLLKRVAITASSLGFTGLWARKRVYLSGQSVLSNLFATHKLCYAFFTGTDSPHRKVAVQIMDMKGGIRGFAKVTCNDTVKSLLRYEAEILGQMSALGLKTALVPNLLLCGSIGGAEVLVTDTLKTANTQSTTILKQAHIAFLHELAKKTAQTDPEAAERFSTVLSQRFQKIAALVPSTWQMRMNKAIDLLGRRRNDMGALSLAHGDFTPWNTFFVEGKLYVFDWEYAQQGCSPGYDLIHFLLSLPAIKKQQIKDTIAQVRTTLQETQFTRSDSTADILLLAYLCCHTLHYIGRETGRKAIVDIWDGEREAGLLLDAVLDLLLRVCP